MAGFETIVRPVIFPNIRPQPKRALIPEDDPEKGVCVISGSSARTIDITYSYSVSTSQSRPVETERRVDTARVYQDDSGGSGGSGGGGVNTDNYIDVEVANKITMRDGEERKPWRYAKVKEAANIEIIARDETRR